MMSGRSTTCFAFHIILLLASILFPVSQSQPSALIDQICKKTPFYDLCSSTLKSSPLSPNPDLKEIAGVMVNDIEAKASETLNYIEEQVKKTTDPNLQRVLGLCAENYVDIVKYVLPQAADAIINKKDFKFASYSVSVAMKDVSSCSKSFTGSPAQPLIGDRNSFVQKLLQVGAAIIQQGL